MMTELIRKIRKGEIKRIQPQPNAVIIFPYSETMLTIEKVTKSYLVANGERYTAKVKGKFAILAGEVYVIEPSNLNGQA